MFERLRVCARQHNRIEVLERVVHHTKAKLLATEATRDGYLRSIVDTRDHHNAVLCSLSKQAKQVAPLKINLKAATDQIDILRAHVDLLKARLDGVQP